MARLKVRTCRRNGMLNIDIGVAEVNLHDVELTESEMCDVVAATDDAGSDLVEAFSYGYNSDSLAAALAVELDLLNTEERGDAGIDYQAGVDSSRDRKRQYAPYLARGLRADPGLYAQVLLDEVGVSRPWQDIVSTMLGGDWYVEAPDAERQEVAEDLERQLKDIRGGWGAFVRSAAYSLISGFVTFEEVFNLDTITLDKLAFRHPKQVVSWIMDADGRELVAVKMARSNSYGADFFIPANALLLVNINAIGDDFEGMSQLRQVVKYHLTKDMFSRLEALAGEKYGTPIFLMSQDGDKAADSGETDLFAEVFDALAAEDMAIIQLPDGMKFEMISPAGLMPSFTEAKRYCDEQISLALQGEGNLLGMQGNGSRALAEVADNRAMRAAPAYAQVICDAINGSRGTPYQGTLRKLERLRYGEPVDGQWCKLKFALNRNGRDSDWLQQIASSVETGLVELLPEDVDMLRAELGLVPMPVKVAEELPTVGTAADIQDTAMNGAQIASMVEVVVAVGDGRLTRSSAIAIIMRAFNVSVEIAEGIVGPASSTGSGGAL